jgi:hypothetical protein
LFITEIIITAVAPSILAIVVSSVVLGLAIAVHRSQLTRGALKRQSMQLLLVLQVVTIIFEVTYMWASVTTLGNMILISL